MLLYADYVTPHSMQGRCLWLFNNYCVYHKIRKYRRLLIIAVFNAVVNVLILYRCMHCMPLSQASKYMYTGCMSLVSDYIIRITLPIFLRALEM